MRFWLLVSEMNTSRKAMKQLVCFSIVNLMLGCLVLLSLCFVLFCLFVCLVFFAILFHLLFSLSLTLIIDFFYCLNYTSLLLHLITINFVSHFSLSSIIFTISILIIGIFYCLNYTLLLLHLTITHLVNIFYNNYVINRCPRQLLWFI